MEDDHTCANTEDTPTLPKITDMPKVTPATNAAIILGVFSPPVLLLARGFPFVFITLLDPGYEFCTALPVSSSNNH
jgi:hypothetical protein